MRWFATAVACSITIAGFGTSAIPAGALSTRSTRSTQSTQSTQSGEACAATVTRDLAYVSVQGVDPNLLSLDVSPVAGTCEAPVAVWVHGGGWRRGDKTNDEAGREAFYNAQGWVLVSVNYRLSTDSADPAVLYPDHNDDVAAALAWVDTHIVKYGGDPSRVALIGHSAGAGIAAALTADPSYLASHDLNPAWLDCVVLLDSEGYEVSSMAMAYELYRNAFGVDPAVWAEASPSEHVGEGPLPDDILIVTRGSVQRIAKARSFADRLTAAGADARVVDVTPLSHAEINKSIGAGDNVMSALMIDELADCAAV